MRKAICYLVGAGPGDPLLMTVKGREHIGQADVIVYDYLCNPDFLAWAPPGAELIYAGKKCGAHVMPQEEINRLLVARTSAGMTVVRLKGGDPFLFGRGGEEAAALADAGCAFEVVPGVSSAISGAIYAGIPLTHSAQDAVLTIFTGHESLEKLKSSLDFSAIAKAPGTKVMLMGIKRLAFVTKELLAAGMDKDLPVALVRWATTLRQESLVGTLSDIAERAEKSGFKAPAIAVFGEVVRLRDKLSWFESLPLFGRTIAVARAREEAGDLVAGLVALGADAFDLPLIRIGPAPDMLAFHEAVAGSRAYDAIILGCRDAASAYLQAFFEISKDVRELGAARIVAIGQDTSETVRAFHLHPDIQLENGKAAAIIKAIEKETSIENLKLLLPRAEGPTGELADELARRGAIVDEISAYQIEPASTDFPGVRRLVERGADLVAFSGPSAAEQFHALNLPAIPGLRQASLCPNTSKTLERLGMPADIQARSVPDFLKAVVRFYARPASHPI
ncbi:MAG: uroporphyrinogen-III C-methyltransferase [Verrucomicrobiae bacterium]